MDMQVTAPEGSHFEFEEVKTAKGQSSLGNVPILVWDDYSKMTEYYGEAGILTIADGTSLRVSFQNIARRMKIAGKTNDEIATAMTSFRPGNRQGGASTPVTRSARLAKTASEKLGDNAAKLEELLGKIASGELSLDEINALVS